MKNVIHRFRCLFTFAAALLCGVPLHTNAAGMNGAIVFDNGAPDHQSANNLGFAWQADDFTLSTGTSITGFRFWSLEAKDAYRGSISWLITRALGGTAIASGTLDTVRRTGLGESLGLDEYLNELSLTAPLALGSGTYWLVLHNGGFGDLGDPNEFLWATSAANGSLRGMESFDGGATWTSNFNEHAFQVSAIPEPASVAMLAAGMLIVACTRRRTQPGARFSR